MRPDRTWCVKSCYNYDKDLRKGFPRLNRLYKWRYFSDRQNTITEEGNFHMLKKMLALLLILAMALGCTVAQAAAPGEATLFGPDEDGTPSNAYPRMFAAVGDTLYMLMNETELEADYGVFNLYSYTGNKSDAPELVA